MEPWYVWSVLDSCNGLLLLDDHLVNPATRQSSRFPAQPPPCAVPGCTSCKDIERNQYLVYDPTVSPHYEVVLIPHIPRELSIGHIAKHACGHGPDVTAMEWPLSPFIIDVFSSKTRCWKEKPYTQEGQAAGTIANQKTDHDAFLYHSAYWHGVRYVRCEEGFMLSRVLQTDTMPMSKMEVIKLPKEKEGEPYLGKSEKGVYCTLIHQRCTCEVWFLDESSGQMHWVLRNEINFELAVREYSWNHVHREPWTLHDPMCMSKNIVNIMRLDDENGTLVKDVFSLDSDDENAIDTAGWPRAHERDPHLFHCFGFYPYKEIVLFYDDHSTVTAYHLKSSKIRYLGKVESFYNDIREWFPYAACWVRDLPGS
uniref:F-box associated domain-containing protein n=1 Tax=Aegilops tauschii TaxID=37682 RepID=M8CG40_AEGTA